MNPTAVPQFAASVAAVRWFAGEHLFWDAPRWQALQSQELAAHLAHARTSPLYRDALHTIDPATPLCDLPLTTKDQLASAGDSLYACDRTEVREWVCTSGTAGKPLHVPLTASDLHRLAANEAVALSIAGVRPGAAFLLAVGMDRLFVAGLAYWLGAQQLGAACIRIGPQQITQPDAIAELLARTGPGHIIAVPSFLGSIDGLDRLRPQVNGIIAIGEPIRSPSLDYNPLGQRIAATFAATVMSTYAATETCATFAEGPLCKGGHLNPQMAAVEILDDAGNSLPPGAIGEVVITPLGVQGLPLLRFRTGDLAALYTDPCPCGRTTPRLGPIVARKHQLLKIRGTSVYPQSIVDALRAFTEVADYAIVAEQLDDLSDAVTIHLHLHSTGDTPENRAAIDQRLRALLRVSPKLEFCTDQSLRRLHLTGGSRKPQHFIDRRVR